MTLYNRIEVLCAQRDINVTQMCRDTGVSRGSISDLAHGRISSLSTKTLQKLSEYFDVSMDYLSGKQDMLVGSEVRKIIKQISTELNEDYEKLENLYMTKQFPRNINYNSLLYFFSIYLGRNLRIESDTSQKQRSSEFIRLFEKMTTEQQNLIIKQIQGILAE